MSYAQYINKILHKKFIKKRAFYEIFHQAIS